MTLDASSTMDVAVIIPTHNRANLLPDAVQSVVDQGSDVRGIIIVDDGSTDNTAEVVKTLRDAAGERLGRPGVRPLRRRVLATFNGCIAGFLLEDRHPEKAAKEFVRCLMLWPVKLGAWRGLAQSLLVALRGGKS